MLKEYATIFRRSMIFLDLCIITGSFFLGYFLREKIGNLYPLSTYISILPLLLLIWGGLLYYFGMYASFRVKRIPEILSIVFRTTLFGLVLFGALTYLFKITEISRIFISLIFIITAILLCLEKTFLILSFRYTRTKGYNYRSLLLVGTGRRAQRFVDLIHKHSDWGFKILGLVDKDPEKVGISINGCKVIGTLADIPQIIHNNVVDEVVFVVPRSWLNDIEEIIQFLESEGVKINLAVDHFELYLSRPKPTTLHGIPLIIFESTPDRLWQLLTKRIIDVIFSAIGLMLFLPLFWVIAVVIKIASRGPVFFRQQRCGLNGRNFSLYKFRTMVEGAELKLSEIMVHNEMTGPVFKMANDPRLTKTGKLLRKFSIDELPQLWNVFKGDMSIVGPRPPLPSEVNNYQSWHRRRLIMRPGITCLWQVNGRNKIVDFDEWARLDLEYIDNWSLWLDFKILFKTLPIVLFGVGAK
jgi:exopolysaccharide biosynthesis polyprenyl glycosylphosphotransferase